MISPPPSPRFASSRANPSVEHKNPAFSPKRASARHKEDPLAQLERPDTHPAGRAPLDPLSGENRCNRRLQSTEAALHHSLVAPSSLPDLHPDLPEHPWSSGSYGVQRNSTLDAPVCAWPPPIPALGIHPLSHSGLLGQHCASPHNSCEQKSTHGPFLGSTSSWHPPDSFQTEPMTQSTRTTEWTPTSMLQHIRPRAGSMPSLRRPPGEFWRSDSGPTKAAHESVDPTGSLICPTPPGLPPRRPELRRCGSNSELQLHGSLSLSLALGSQPLLASEHTKAVPPIGAERSLLSPEKVQAEAGYASTAREDLERLLRHAVHNKHAPKITSPLSPLRTMTPAFDLSADPAYRLRMPSQSNAPSLRYSKCPPRRARTVCDGYQSLNWDATCMHCQECQRDTLCKKLLAFRYRQHQTHALQRHKFHPTYPVRGHTSTSIVADDDRMALASRIREVFAYEMDEEEKSLWEEVAAATGVAPLPFSRAGASCGAATHYRALDDGPEDGVHEDCLEISDDGFFANASVTLFRDVSVY